MYAAKFEVSSITENLRRFADVRYNNERVQRCSRNKMCSDIDALGSPSFLMAIGINVANIVQTVR